MATRFIDTNIFLRYFTRDDEDKASRAFALLTRVEQGQERLETSLLVVFEMVFTLQKAYGVPKARIRELVTPLLRLRGLHVPNKNVCLEALDLFVDHNISFADAFNAAYMKSRALAEIYSWDKDFDGLQGIVRLVPEGDV